MDTLLRLTATGEPEIDRPAPDRVIAGDPVHSTWLLEDRDGLFAGIWESTPGAWRVVYDEWEYCRILSGRSVLRPENGAAVEVGPGDSFVLRPGFRGVWEVVKTTRKEFVVRV